MRGNGGATDRVSSTRAYETSGVFPLATVAARAGWLRLGARAAHEPHGAVDHAVPGPGRTPAGELAAVGTRCVRPGCTPRPADPFICGSGRLSLVRGHGPRGVRRPRPGGHDRFVVRTRACRP